MTTHIEDEVYLALMLTLVSACCRIGSQSSFVEHHSLK
jgi:hypothetical protein